LKQINKPVTVVADC